MTILLERIMLVFERFCLADMTGLRGAACEFGSAND
jgi:hypothetical protein